MFIVYIILSITHKRELKDLGFHTETDEFNDKPPTFAKLKFTNIIAKLNPDADKYLTLACHYDSKYYREHYFAAATDSAVPCAIILNIAKTLMPMLKSNKDRTNLSLMVFLIHQQHCVEFLFTGLL